MIQSESRDSAHVERFSEERCVRRWCHTVCGFAIAEAAKGSELKATAFYTGWLNIMAHMS